MKQRLFFGLILSALLCSSAVGAFAQTKTENVSASLYVTPANGTFTVGSTFTVSFYLNTGGQFINAVEARLQFPQDKLQVVSPSTGSSFISVWTAQPSYSNTDGTLTFIGAVPSPGINTSAGLISTVTFRVKTVGSAIIKFLEPSRVLLNDGNGTDVLSKTSGGLYNLVLPPPAGPAVSSQTNPDQQSWYARDSVELSWLPFDTAQGYSYMLSDTPVDNPDNISEGNRQSVIYKNVSDGVHYFHIKALSGGIWGGVTHFAVKVDTAPPAAFTINVSPGRRTTNPNPIIAFDTTDESSGFSHYELSLISLQGAQEAKNGFFIEASSPFTPQLKLGTYDVIVRAYDNAGNMREQTERLSIVSPLLGFTTSDGLTIYSFTLPWFMVIILLLAAIGVSWFYASLFMRRHREIHAQLAEGALNDPIIRERLKALQERQKRYVKAVVMLFVVAVSVFSSAGAPSAQAQSSGELVAPPIVTVVSRSISNQDLFYVGGETPFKQASIVIYIQDLASGAVSNFETTSDDKGQWFYSHDKFLPAGSYALWLQTKVGDRLSPPSAQSQLTVTPTAIELGSSRLSYEFIYFIIALALLIVVIIQIALGAYHLAQHNRKRAILADKIKEAEDSIRRGFAVLRHDIEAELRLIHGAKLKGPLAEAEKAQEELLLKDLEIVSGHVGKEIWEIESMEKPF